MVESKSHKSTSNRLAKKHKTEYNTGQGADIQTNKIAIEVETPGTVADGLRQLQGHKKPVYIAGTNQEAVDKALEVTKSTTIGVMDNQGKIVKRSTRKKTRNLTNSSISRLQGVDACFVHTTRRWIGLF